MCMYMYIYIFIYLYIVIYKYSYIYIYAFIQEIIPGYKFSRGAYLAGLLRPQIIKDLELEKYGFKYLGIFV
jgi:hypothetical protein